MLPLLPILFATALAEHRWGPWMLAAGMTLSFAGFGLFVATVGISLGLDRSVLRPLAAASLLLFGTLLVSSRLQARFEQAVSGLAEAGGSMIARLPGKGLLGDFAVGLCLGLLWSPCVGPALGAATTLATQGTQLAEVGLFMVLFGIGASTPLLVLGSLSRTASARLRAPMLRAGRDGKRLLGTLMLVIAFGALSGLDRRVEAWLLAHAPAWLNTLSTKY